MDYGGVTNTEVTVSSEEFILSAQLSVLHSNFEILK